MGFVDPSPYIGIGKRLKLVLFNALKDSLLSLRDGTGILNAKGFQTGPILMGSSGAGYNTSGSYATGTNDFAFGYFRVEPTEATRHLYLIIECTLHAQGGFTAYIGYSLDGAAYVETGIGTSSSSPVTQRVRIDLGVISAIAVHNVRLAIRTNSGGAASYIDGWAVGVGQVCSLG